MNIAVVVVSYNTRDLLRQCIASIDNSVRASHIDALNTHIVVVDNGSSDGSASMVAHEFPHTRLVASPENLGFTRANNLALSLLEFGIAGADRPLDREPPDYVLLLNPDAELVDDALGQMVQLLEDDPSAGACGARLEYSDGSFQHGAFQFPSPFQVALDLAPMAGIPGSGRLYNRLYNSRVNGRYPAALWEEDVPFQVDFVLGAALMMRGAAIQRIGGLDEGYFMYCEEMDWCLRLKQTGMSTFAVPAARVIHHEAQSSRQTPWLAYRNLWRSRLRFYDKHRDQFRPGQPLLVRALIRISIRSRVAQTRRRFAQGQLTGSEAAAELDAYKYVAHL